MYIFFQANWSNLTGFQPIKKSLYQRVIKDVKNRSYVDIRVSRMIEELNGKSTSCVAYFKGLRNNLKAKVGVFLEKKSSFGC
jgi:hypothetical protein